MKELVLIIDMIQFVIENYLSEIISFFSLIVSFFILHEARKMWELNTEPEVIYYVTKIDGFYYAILENIGNGVAYNIICELTFDSEIEKPYLDPSIEKAKVVKREFEYLAPGQTLTFKMGGISLSKSLVGFDTHRVQLKYNKKKQRKETTVQFIINKSTIVHLENKGNLKTIAEKLEDIENKLEPYKNIISVKSDS